MSTNTPQDSLNEFYKYYFYDNSDVLSWLNENYLNYRMKGNTNEAIYNLVWKIMKAKGIDIGAYNQFRDGDLTK